MNKKIKSSLMLLLTAFIWGTGFVAQKTGMEHIDPFTFNAARSIFACATLAVVIPFLDMGKPRTEKTARGNRDLILGGISCGAVLFVASSLQQFGIMTTSAGKTGFITALYIVLVPILSRFIGRVIRPVLWLCVLLSMVGLWLLTMKGGFSIEKGDLLILICAFFAIHILVIGHFSPKTDGVKMSLLQFAVCAVLCCIASVIFESPDLSAMMTAIVPIAYAGIMSSGVAYTLQIVAQKDADPTVACLLMSLESVFSVLVGWIILGEQLSPKELTGCAIMFVAVVLSQLPPKEQILKGRKHND